jgi:hypothetical protein
MCAVPAYGARLRHSLLLSGIARCATCGGPLGTVTRDFLMDAVKRGLATDALLAQLEAEHAKR